MTDKVDATKAGVADSWDHWLEQHPVSVGELIQGAVKAAVNEWLNRHGEALFASAIEAAVKKAAVVELAASPAAHAPDATTSLPPATTAPNVGATDEAER
ncbi:hypothetical protein [Micromonospora aurantiaca]|uniref:hypothetical protein n=1 Tax=Micromonospora aurantiaca (nom. illeg.) TaxID=47850 RepID=UPI0011CE8680|nr:hypothetical protein [Micromonospora aurantiaca]